MIDGAHEEFSKLLKAMENFSEKYKNEKICELDNEQLEQYKQKLETFKKYNKMKRSDPQAPSDLIKKKGDSLEELVAYLLKISGNLFEVERNLRTSTNEIDQIIVLTGTGKMLLSGKLLNSKFDTFLGECKNYHKKVGVTYVGKLCSLLVTNQIKLGIMFSYHGVTGKNWNDSSGLIKKFYLHKEKLEERYCIIDFSLKDFESIMEGKNFIDIVEAQLKALQLDTDYTIFLSKHPAEN